MRLTQKADKEHEHFKMCIGWYELPTKDYHVRVINETLNQMYQKLGQLEDIEDELGCSLQLYYIMCIKGTELYAFSGLPEIKKPIKQWFSKYTFNKEKLSFGKIMDGYGWIEFYKLSEYGITWALTKEELEQ